ncbi:MAG: GNAT family N-acetyltransferase [Methanosphaera sp.]|nr:GNAT family N-acetyltransferase [Methanosphaera sp.]
MSINKVKFDNLNDFLKENYEEIYEAITKERYILEYTENKHVIFKELKYNDKIVGFALVDLIMLDKPKYSVCECYVIPEYRGNNILFDFIISNISKTNYDFSFRRPNNAIMNLLLKYNLAFSLDRNIIISFIELDVSLDEVYVNKNIKKLYNTVEDEMSDEIFSTYYYNSHLQSVTFFDLSQSIAKNSYTLCVAKPREYDLVRYKLRKNLKNLTEKSMDKNALKLVESNDRIQDFINTTQNELEEVYSVENIIGRHDHFTKSAQYLLDQYDISGDDANAILDKITDKLDDGKILNFTIPDYFNYLVRTFNEDSNVFELPDSVEVKQKDGIDYYEEDNLKVIICPECHHENTEYNVTCENCGYNINIF